MLESRDGVDTTCVKHVQFQCYGTGKKGTLEVNGMVPWDNELDRVCESVGIQSDLASECV